MEEEIPDLDGTYHIVLSPRKMKSGGRRDIVREKEDNTVKPAQHYSERFARETGNTEQSVSFVVSKRETRGGM